MGLDYELGAISFRKRPDRYQIDTEKYPETNFNKHNLVIEVHHSIGTIEWNPKKFKIVSALEIFKDVLNQNGSLNRELVLERFKKHNPLNAAVLEYVQWNGTYFENDRRWDEDQIKLGSDIAYGGTIYLLDNKPIIRASGILYDGFWNPSSRAIFLDNTKILSRVYCPILG